MSQGTWAKSVCEYCWHDDELHDLGPSQRTPKLMGDVSGTMKYACSDCADCAREAVHAT
jgi:hypothetical protein